MASLMINGCKVLGGGSGNTDTREVTMEEYQALGDRVNSDNITYIITDDVYTELMDGAVYLTKAEYDALGDSTKNDGVLYIITDADDLLATTIGCKNDRILSATNVQNALDNIVESEIGENLAQYPYKSTTKTGNGITFTDNGDGSITIGAGTATVDAIFAFFDYTTIGNTYFDKNETYTISGGYSNKVVIMVARKNADLTNYKHLDDTGKGITFKMSDFLEADDDVLTFRLAVYKGTTITEPITIKPMLEKGTVVHKWQPNKLSREVLDKKIEDINSSLASKGITYLCHSNSVTLETKDIDISNYDALIMTQVTSGHVIGSTTVTLDTFTAFSASLFDNTSKYSGAEYQGIIYVNNSKITGIQTSANNCITVCYGIKY